jgi:hypothetical protein
MVWVEKNERTETSGYAQVSLVWRLVGTVVGTHDCGLDVRLIEHEHVPPWVGELVRVPNGIILHSLSEISPTRHRHSPAQPPAAVRYRSGARRVLGPALGEHVDLWHDVRDTPDTKRRTRPTRYARPTV